MILISVLALILNLSPVENINQHAAYKTVTISLGVDDNARVVKCSDSHGRDSLIHSVCNREFSKGYRLKEVIPLIHTSWGGKIGTNSVYTGELILIFEHNRVQTENSKD